MNGPSPFEKAPTDGPDGPARRILISAAEPSADLHGASLIREVVSVCPRAEFAGLGGPRIREAGGRTIDDFTGRASMLLGTLGLVGRALRLMGRVERLVAEQAFALAVLIDSPVLNLALAKRLRDRGIPVLYYVAPQTWAWAEYRWRKVARRVDRMAVILPFEEQYWRIRGVRADYVGHPLFDSLAANPPDRELAASLRRGGGPVIALLPGSRRQVVREVLPGQLQVCRLVARRFPHARFLLSLAGAPVRDAVESLVSSSGVEVQVEHGRNGELLSAADLVLVASGTATLEVAYYRAPMIVMYNHSPLGYQLVGRWLISTKWLSLPNIIAGREMVPEFMPYFRSVQPIADRVFELLSAPEKLRLMAREIDAVMTPLIKTGASARTARIVLEMLGERAACPIDGGGDAPARQG